MVQQVSLVLFDQNSELNGLMVYKFCVKCCATVRLLYTVDIWTERHRDFNRKAAGI